jgi:hypothetical protein
MCFKFFKIDIKVLLNYRFYVFFLKNEFKTLRGNFFLMYIIEEMLSMSFFYFFILTNYEFLTLNSKFYIKP